MVLCTSALRWQRRTTGLVELLELGPFYIVIWLEVLFELFIRCCNTKSVTQAAQKVESARQVKSKETAQWWHTLTQRSILCAHLHQECCDKTQIDKEHRLLGALHILWAISVEIVVVECLSTLRAGDKPRSFLQKSSSSPGSDLNQWCWCPQGLPAQGRETFQTQRPVINICSVHVYISNQHIRLGSRATSSM